MKKCCVIGSVNVDMVMTVPRFHVGGETIKGSALNTFMGGKGGNQAVALARLGVPVAMAGCVGDDSGGAAYLSMLQKEGVDTALMDTRTGVATGTALIEVEEKTGQNRIAIFAGANGLVDRAYIDGIFDRLIGYDVFLLQFEIPEDTVCYAAKRLHDAGKTVILDPAPAPNGRLAPELLAYVDFITPNETELAAISGVRVDAPEQAVEAANALLAQGARAVIAKLGKAGATLVQKEGATHVPGYSVNAVDTTAAGDSFNAGFACALADGAEMTQAIRFANATGAMATTKMGAQSGMPERAQVERLMKEQT